MKTVLKILSTVLIFTFVTISNAQNVPLERNYFQLSPRIGYDFPSYNNDTPYIDYKGGIDLGISFDYYFNWFGLGADFDFIKNKPKSTYPTNLGTINTTLIENGITRLFYGIGPNAQIRSSSGKFKTEFNTRFGLASIKGGRTLLTNITSSPPKMLNFHAGYNLSNVFSFKGQVKLTYFLSKNFGFNVGTYYLKHFNTKELLDPSLGISAGYQPFNDDEGHITIKEGNPKVRAEPCNCGISSIGLFAGVTIKFNKTKVCPVCGKEHTPFCCSTCGCSVTITAKDKYTGETLPNTDVVLADINGNIVQSATTNSYGVVVFKEVKEDNYLIRGKLYGVTLEEGSITKEEFKNCKQNTEGIQKVIEYADRNFILQGQAVVCNTNKPLSGVSVFLKHSSKAEEKRTVTDNKGEYIFHINENATYTIRGKKDNYFSQIETVSTSNYNRNTTLFVKLEVCLTYVECNTTIPLKNIHFALDKDIVRENAKIELNKLVDFMKTYPLIKVELSSHTDSQGSDAYNEDLSQRRANNSAAYIISQGINPNRIVAKGYGEYRLLNHCANGVKCSDAEHEVNRRTEFKVLCPE
ncbi:OmpA family protein [Tenacibaculum sp. UWU-22]|uniref:OmpA family protein n=1 Tax=Tenacibaculum sp. UWU-22 TaxID=3234187 RepID=UPI0034DAE40B